MKTKTKYGMFVMALITVAALLGGCWNATLEERAERITERVSDELEMNEEQSTQFQSSTLKLLEKGQEFRDIRTSLVEELVSQLRSDAVDEAHLNEVLTQNKAKLEAMMDLFVEQFSTIHQGLTPEQRAAAADKFEKLQDRHSHRRWGSGMSG